tara:strand:+ start:1543 stop:4185 length:2643 start_codon:yes stop_codon:yes gene_type:complete
MFNYGDISEKDPHFKVCLEREFFEENQYEKYVKVKEGDVVVDIGASIGPFLYTIKDRNPSNVIAVEPFSSYHPLLLENKQGLSNLKLYKNAIGILDNEVINLEWSSEKEQVTTITFPTIIKENNLKYIDFLKLDCEGGEYHIFNSDNIDYLKNNVGYIVGEFHLNTPSMKDSFISTYKLLNKHGINFKIESVNGVCITQQFKDDVSSASQHYSQIIVYIDNKKLKKLLYIAPHLSTGGLPQYLVKKVELLKNEFDIHLIEWVDCTGGAFVVQRDKLIDLIDPQNFHTLEEDKSSIFDIINNINPDIIHLEEIPEYFMGSDIAEKIYSPHRNYHIVETSHDSSFDTTQKRFFPDKFMFVSDWQIKQYKDLDIPKILVEYPIEYNNRPNREESLKLLGLNPDKKHILHVGLFTPRKNQKEFFKYAESLPEYEFHCLGNQAENFKFYWEPLMKNKPSNLTWWGERSDVEKFYESMDLFLFTSRGTDNDKETMPLVIREALSNKIPQLLHNLPVYLNYFDKFDSIQYLDNDNFTHNCKLIDDKLSDFQRVLSQDEVFIITTYPSTNSAINTTLDCVKTVQSYGYKVILTSHIPIPHILQSQADYCVVDNNNILTKHTYYNTFNWDSEGCKVYVNLKGENNDTYHGPSVYTNNYNGAALASSLGFTKSYFLNYDYILKDKKGIDYVSNILNKNNFYFSKHHPLEGDALYTYFFAGNPKELLRVLPKIENGEQYDNLVEFYGSESNGLENLFHHIFKNEGSIYREEESSFGVKSKETFDHRNFSQVEYFTILPTNKPNHFAPYFYISNVEDSRTIQYKVRKDGIIVADKKITKTHSFWDVLKFDGEYEITFEISDNSDLSQIKTFKIDQNYYNNILPNNGNLTLNI